MLRHKSKNILKLFVCFSFMMGSVSWGQSDLIRDMPISATSTYIGEASPAVSLSPQFAASLQALNVCKKSVFALTGSDCNKSKNSIMADNVLLEQMAKSASQQDITKNFEKIATNAEAQVARSQQNCSASAYNMKNLCEVKIATLIAKEKKLCDDDANAAAENIKQVKLAFCESESAKIAASGKTQYKIGWAVKISFIALTVAALVQIRKLLKNTDKAKKDVAADDSSNINNPNYNPHEDRDVVPPSSPDIDSTTAAGGTTANSGDGATTPRAAASTVNVKDFEGYDPAQEYNANTGTSNKSGTNDFNKSSNAPVGTSASEVNAKNVSNSAGGPGNSYGGGGVGENISSGGYVSGGSGSRELAAYMPGGEKDPRTDIMRKYEEARSQIRPAHGYSNFEAIHKVADREFPN